MKKLVGYLFLALFFAGLLPVCARVLLGVYFLPSTGWIAQMATFATVLGLLMGTSSVVLMFVTRKTNPKLVNVSRFKLGVALLGVFVLMWMAGQQLVLVSYPMAHAGWTGGEMRLPYVVKKSESNGSRGCRPAIKLANMPLMIDELCDSPKKLRMMLSPGDIVYAVGNGSSLGVYYTSFERSVK